MSATISVGYKVPKTPDVELFVWHKRPSGDTRGDVLFVHGSSQASQPCFDLIVEGDTELSLMERFAAEGWRTWCFDCEGYGRSSKHRSRPFGIADGADDIEVVVDFITKETGSDKVNLYGGSAGALRAAVYTSRHPSRVSRLAMDAFVWTGQDSPTLAQRRKRLPELQASPRRPISRATLSTIFDRDHPGSSDQKTVDAFIEAVLALDDSIPNGTYIDMCTNLPVIQPDQLDVPVLIVRGEWDGIASLADVLEFFEKLPNPDKQFVVLPGVAHAALNGKNHAMAIHTLLSYFSRPDPVYLG